MPYKYDLFISHSSKNKDIADYLVKRIEERGYKCFIAPRDINPSAEYASEIIVGISNSIAVLLIFSHDSDKSAYVVREINSAVSRNKPIIPFRIEDILPSESMEFYLGAIHWLNAFPQILDSHLDEVIKRLQALKNIEKIDKPKKNFKIIGPQLLNPEDISELDIDYKSFLMKKIEIDYICIPTSATEKDSEKNSEELHNLRQNFEVENSVLLIKNDEIIGYCDLCPVTKDAYNELVTGKSLLQENMLDVYFSGDTIDICIPMLAILPTHSKLDNYGLIFEWIFQKFLNWYEDEITVNRICISVYSPMLDKIVRKFGFTEQCCNPLNGKIYSTSLAELKENKSVGKGKKYKKFFENILIPEEIKINVDNNPNAKTSDDNKTTNEKVFGSETEPITKIMNEKKSAPTPPTATTPEPKLDAQPITIATYKITNENISSENQSPPLTTEKVQENGYSSSIIKQSPTNKSELTEVHYDFFISYSVKNINTVNRIVEKIEKRGYKCFIAPRNTISIDYKKEINLEIINSTAILLIFSFSSDTSNFVFNELDVAVSRNKPIIPIKIENITPSKTIQLRLGNIQWIEAISGIQDTHIDKIIEQLKIAKQTKSAPKISLDSSTTKKDSEKTSSSPNLSDIPQNISRNETISADNEKTKSGSIQSKSETKTNPTTKIQPIHVEPHKSKPLKTVLELALERNQTENTSPQSVSVSKKNTGSLIPTDKKYSPTPSPVIKTSTKSETTKVHYDFYISYSKKNSNVANYVVEKIERRGYKCFIAPRDINPISDYTKEITTAISDYTKEITTGMENSSAIILILSSDSNVSVYIDKEIMLAVALKKPIIPFQIEYVILSEELESHLRNIPIIDAYPKILDTHFDAITETFNTLKNNNYSYPIIKKATRKTTAISENIDPIKSLSTYLESLRRNPLYKFDGNVYISGQSETGDKKIKNAEKYYANLQKGETSLLCLDITNSGVADQGILATTKGVYVKDIKGNSNFYPYDNFPNLIIFSKSNGYHAILFGLETENGISVMTDFKQTFLFLDLLNQFQREFNTNQKKSKFIDWKLLKDSIDPYMLLPIDERTILYFCYGEDSNENLNSIIEKNISISLSEKILIFGNLANLKHSAIISHIEQSKSLPPYSFLATTKGIYVNNDSKYKNVFIGYNEIHSFTALFQEYKNSPNRTEVFVYCSEKKYFPIKTKLVQFLCVPVVELLNKLRDNFIAKQNSSKIN